LEDAQKLYRGVYEVRTTESSKYDGLLESKRKVESGVAFGPKRLADESKSLHSTEKQKFGGDKDLFMALGFCYNHLKQEPYQLPVIPAGPGRFDPNRFLSKPRRY
jgi:hypothetical protein